MANFPWFFGHFEDSFLLSLFLLFFPHIWPYLWNYWSDWTEFFCEGRFWPSSGTHQITAFKVERCRRYWVVRLTCKWCGWAARLCTLKAEILQEHRYQLVILFKINNIFVYCNFLSCDGQILVDFLKLNEMPIIFILILWIISNIKSNFVFSMFF